MSTKPITVKVTELGTKRVIETVTLTPSKIGPADTQGGAWNVTRSDGTYIGEVESYYSSTTHLIAGTNIGRPGAERKEWVGRDVTGETSMPRSTRAEVLRDLVVTANHWLYRPLTAPAREVLVRLANGAQQRTDVPVLRSLRPRGLVTFNHAVAGLNGWTITDRGREEIGH